MMPEYITKDQAYLCMLENWDGDMLPGDYDDLLREIPPADVVEVVRCGDCRSRMYEGPYLVCRKFTCVTDSRDYCSHAVKGEPYA